MSVHQTNLIFVEYYIIQLWDVGNSYFSVHYEILIFQRNLLFQRIFDMIYVLS